MIGVDLFLVKRKKIFSDEVIKRFFTINEQTIIFQSYDKQLLASKIFAIKEAVYKLLHNLNSKLEFNKFRFEIDYVDFVFKVKYIEGLNKDINNFMQSINFNNIYISDSDEGQYIFIVALYQPTIS